MGLRGLQKENTQSIPSSGSSHLNPNGELAGVLLKLRAQSSPGSPLPGGDVKTRGCTLLEPASSPTLKLSQELSPARHRVPQFIEPNLLGKPIDSIISASSSSKKSPGKNKSTPVVPLQPEEDRIPYFLRLATLQKENTSDATHVSPSFITQIAAENSETQDSSSQRSDRYNPLPLTVEPTPPIIRGGLGISQASTEYSQSSQGRSPPPGQGGILVQGTPSSAPSPRSRRRSSLSADGFDFDISQTLDLGGNPSRLLFEFDPTQPTQILFDADEEADLDAPTQVLPSQPILRPYGAPLNRVPGHAAPVLGLPSAVPLRKRPPTRYESFSNKDAGTQELIKKPLLTQESSFHLPGLEPTPPIFEPHATAEPSTPPSFPISLPELSPGIVPDSEDGRRAGSLDLNSDKEEEEEVQPLKHRSYFPYVQTQEQVRYRAHEGHTNSLHVTQDDETSIRVQASGQGSLPPTQRLVESPYDLEAWPNESSTTIELPRPPSQKTHKIKDRTKIHTARKVTRIMKEKEKEADSSDEPDDENDEDYDEKPLDPRRVPVIRGRNKRAPRTQGTGPSPKRKRTESKAEVGPSIRRNTRQAQTTSTFATHGPSFSVDETSGILVMYKSGKKCFAGWAVPLSTSKWMVRPCDRSSTCELNFSQVYRCEFMVGDEIDVLPDKTKQRESFGLATIVSIDDLNTKLWVRVKFSPKDEPDIVLNITLAEVSLQAKPVKDNPRWRARLLRKDDLKQMPRRPVTFPLPVTMGWITPLPVTPIRVNTNTRAASTAPGSKWLSGVGIIFTNSKSPGIDQHKELVQKRGGEVLQSLLSCFSFKGEFNETQTKWTSKRKDVVKWVGDRRPKTKNIKTMFVITGPPSHTPKLLIAMALGVPCVDPLWLVHCESAVRAMSPSPTTRKVVPIIYLGTPYQLDAIQDRECSL